MILSGRSTFVKILIWVNLTVLVFGLLLLRNGNRTSADREEGYGDKTADQKQQSYHSTSSYSLSNEDSAAQPRRFFRSNGLLRAGQIHKGFRKSPSEIDNSLCQKSPQQLPKYLVFRRLVQCYRRANADDELKMNRRFLITSTQVRNDEVPGFEEKTSSSISRDEAAFHIDYSGPKTHPPKNN